MVAHIAILPVIFKARGFPGNDMKHLNTGASNHTLGGDKPSHKDMEYVEKMYPGAHKTNKEAERFMDTAKTGSKDKSFGRR